MPAPDPKTTEPAPDIMDRLYAKANLMGLAGVDEFDGAQEIARLRMALARIAAQARGSSATWAAWAQNVARYALNRKTSP